MFLNSHKHSGEHITIFISQFLDSFNSKDIEVHKIVPTVVYTSMCKILN